MQTREFLLVPYVLNRGNDYLIAIFFGLSYELAVGQRFPTSLCGTIYRMLWKVSPKGNRSPVIKGFSTCDGHPEGFGFVF